MPGESEQIGMEIRLTESPTSAAANNPTPTSQPVRTSTQIMEELRRLQEQGVAAATSQDFDAAADITQKIAELHLEAEAYNQAFNDDLDRLIRREQRRKAEARDEPSPDSLPNPSNIADYGHELFANLLRQQGGAGGAANIVGGAAGGIAGRFLGPTAAGAIGGATGTIAGLAANPLTVPIAAFLLATGAAAEVLEKVINRLDNLETEFGKYSGAVSSARAARSVQELQTNLHRANVLGPDMAELITSRGNINAELAKLEVEFFRHVLPLITEGAKDLDLILAAITSVIEPLSKFLALYNKAPEQAAKWFGLGPDEAKLFGQLFKSLTSTDILSKLRGIFNIATYFHNKHKSKAGDTLTQMQEFLDMNRFMMDQVANPTAFGHVPNRHRPAHGPTF